MSDRKQGNCLSHLGRVKTAGTQERDLSCNSHYPLSLVCALTSGCLYAALMASFGRLES